MLKSCKLATLALALGLCLSATAQAQSPLCGQLASIVKNIKQIGSGVSAAGRSFAVNTSSSPMARAAAKCAQQKAFLDGLDASTKVCGGEIPSNIAPTAALNALCNSNPNLTVGDLRNSGLVGRCPTAPKTRDIGSILAGLGLSNKFTYEEAKAAYDSLGCPAI